MSNDYSGSEWHKWDLHIHTPESVLCNNFKGDTNEEKWENYLTKLETIADVAVLGLTDYFSVDGYKRAIEFRKAGRLTNIPLILPNIELRLLPVTVNERPINFHIIFSPSIVDNLDSLFFTNLDFNYQENSYKCVRADLIRLGRAVNNNLQLDEIAAYRTGVEQFKTTIKDLTDIFNKNKLLAENCITVVPNSNNDGNSGIQEDCLVATRQEIYRFANAIFSSNPRDREYFLGRGVDSKEEVIRKTGSLKPCIHGSDAHSLDDICRPDLNRYTWIKSDLTFNGLKQILYEPETRVSIAPLKPILPPHRIEKVAFNFPSTCTIGNDRFCFAGKTDFAFSPFFNCIIGGRGTGKSMIINLLHEKCQPGKNSFFSISENKIRDDKNNVVQIGKLVDIGPETDLSLLEFISQNQIEDFAKDNQKLTTAIYNRLLRRDENNILGSLQTDLVNNLLKLDDIQKAKQHLKQQSDLLEIKRNEKCSFQRIVESLSSEEYKNITLKIKANIVAINSIKQSETNYSALISDLTCLVDKYQLQSSSNTYDTFINDIVTSISTIISKYQNVNLSEITATISTLEQQLTTQKDSLKTFLAEKGLSEENLKDISEATVRVQQLEKEVIDTEKEIANIQKTIVSFDLAVVTKSYEAYSAELKEHIGRFSQLLKDLKTQYVKPITLEFGFDTESARTSIFKDFSALFSERWQTANTYESYLKEILFKFAPSLNFTKDELIRSLKEITSTQSKAKDVLIELFQDDYVFDQYLTIVRRHLLDISSNLSIRVLYDNRPLGQTSFGQRCTAALVILLLLGNTPVIIDEPEAHLDSLLISNYLVDIIKKNKSSRQIIFATHNANFVINGDAELIHVLHINDAKTTSMISTSIENTDYRSDLIALEGGKEAFEQRENRYKS